MEIRRTSRPYLLVLLMLLGLWLGSVLAKGASNQSTSQTWQHQQQQQQQRYQSQLNESQSQPEELEILETTSAVVSSPHETHLTRTSVIFGLTKVANESSVSQKCHAQLRQVQRGILGKQPWAMKGKWKNPSQNIIVIKQKKIPCWDVPANWAKIFAVRENSPNEIPLMNGLRSVCAIWIMVFHVVWFMYFTVHNKTVLISYAEQAFFQYVSSAPLLVDVFFTISGFLQTFNFLRNSQQLEAVRRNSFVGNLKLFGKLLFHRYLRLGPLYLVVMATVDLVYAYIGDVSVYHINERFDEMCSKHWWRNLLFIQNLFDHRDMCANWSWSLACEMQFFILANALLFLYVKYPKIVKALVASSFVATIAWSYSIGLSIKFQLSFDAAFATGTEIYTSPFVRVLPYILGAATAWLFLENRIQLEISEPKERFCWHLALLVFFACIYSTVKRDLGPLMAITLFVMGRLFFSLSVCWMIARSCSGRGVWWS
uniref:Nose resistant to fluoxetine protein 6-like n=1 Tax=Drosophila rhopaloa TaxID=1041015 RepID=A0A6P4ECQ7_DRORH